jgi:bifunctional non-homologous end joining protein LigD
MPRPSPAKLPGKEAPYPGFIAPSLASSINKPPAGARWLHEVKFDGYRVQLHIHATDIKVYTRNGNDWTGRFKVVAEAAWHQNVKTAIIDGEIVVPNEDGTTDFSQLQRALKASKPSDKLALYAFDLLYLDGSDLRSLPLVQRKAMLAKLIARTDLLYSEHFETTGAELLKNACSMGLEGIVAKQKDAPYRSGRTDTWIKMTCRQRETLPIVGYAIKENRFDGLILGRREGDELIYAGKVDHGFSRDDERYVRSRLGPLVQKAQAFSRKIKKPNAVWVKPDLRAEVEY